jgi:RecA-family ATPase
LSNLKTTDELFNMLSTEVQISKHNLIVIDNLMSILHVAKGDEKLEAQADFVQRCCDLAKAEKIHIILVLHPNKTISKGQKMEFEAISGTSDIYNKADNIIAVTRLYDDNNTNYGIDGEFDVLKNRYYPENPCVKVHFHKENTNYYEIDDSGKYKVKKIKGIENID